MKIHLRILAIISSLTIFGCGGGPSGPPQFELSGTVNYDGKPVPVGTILISPDSSKGAEGPSAVVDIKNGAYRTERGKGHVGGAYVLTIKGYDGKPPTNPDPTNVKAEGELLFSNYLHSVDLPKSAKKLDIDVPPQKTK